MLPNVLILQYDNTKPSGAQIVGLKLSNELARFYDVTIVSLYSDFSGKTAIPVSTEIQQITLFENKQNLFLNSKSIAQKLSKIIWENNIDCIISISPSFNLILSLIRKERNIKVIYAEHANLENKYSDGKLTPFYRWVGSKTLDYIVLLTERERDKFLLKYNTHSSRVKTIPNWVDLDNSGINNSSLKTNEATKRIISVGRLEYVKGFDMLLKVALILKKKKVDFRWDIYGEGSQRDSLIKQIKEMSLSNNVVIKGHCNDMHSRYEDYDILVMTSRSEGLPLVLLEGLSHGLPLVAFDIDSGPSEIIEEGNTGYLIQPFDLEHMSDKIEQVLHADSCNLAMDANSAIKKFDKNTIINEWKKIL